MPSFQFGNSEIGYELISDERKDVVISVDWECGVRIKVPKEITQQHIEKIINKKAPWIYEKLNNLSEIETVPQPLNFLSGEKIPYLGRRYRLKVHKSNTNSFVFESGRFQATIKPSFSETEQTIVLRDQCIQWIQLHGKKKLMQRSKYFEEIMEVKPSGYEVKEQNLRWGSCTKNGQILINWRVFLAPLSIVDYILVHELAHLRFPNHSNDFWKLVGFVMPDYNDRKEWLRIHGPTLIL